MAENYCSRDFRDSVTVERGVESADGYGGFTIVWSTQATLFGLIETTGGDEPLQGGRLEPTETVTVVTHHRTDLLASDRLVIDGENYNITRLENIDRRDKWLRIYAETGVRT